jgi:hypothetical protein
VQWGRAESEGSSSGLSFFDRGRQIYNKDNSILFYSNYIDGTYRADGHWSGLVRPPQNSGPRSCNKTGQSKTGQEEAGPIRGQDIKLVFVPD